MTGSQPVIKTRFFDSNGKPLNGGKLYSYQAGTSTPKATYSDPACTTPNTNPVVMDADGYCDLWIKQGSYKFVLKDSNDVQIFEKDGIPSLASLVGEVSGALMAVNNLSDLDNAATALTNLGLTATATELNYVDGVTSAIQTQIDTTDDKIDNHIADASAAHAGSAISNTPSGNLSATDVQAALDELQSDIDTRALDSDLDAHISDTSTHGVTGSVVGTTDTQTLTNKTFDDELRVKELSATPSTPGAGYKKLYAKDDGKVYQLNSDAIEKELGSGGAGSGGKNYAADLYDGTSIEGIKEYDADGNIILNPGVSLNTDTPLRGDSNQRLSKDAADSENYEFEIKAFTLDRKDYESGERQFVKFGYKTSANYVSGDLKLYVYDVTADSYTALVNDQDGELLAASSPGDFIGAFYPNTSHSDYKFVARVNSTNALAWDVDGIDWSIGPETLVPVPIVTEWQSYTPTFTNFGTVSNVAIQSRRVGDSLEIKGRFTTGTVAGSTVSMTYGYNGVNGGVALDTTKATAGDLVGFGTGFAPSTTAFHLGLIAQSTTLQFGVQSSTVSESTAATGGPFPNSGVVHINAKIPISGWSAGAMLSTTEVLNRNQFFRATLSATQSISNNSSAKILFDNITDDNLSAWDATNHRLYVKASTYYQITGQGYFGMTTTTGSVRADLYVNGTRVDSALAEKSGNTTNSLTVPFDFSRGLKAGDYIEIYFYQTNSGGGAGNLQGDSSIDGATKLVVQARPDLTTFSIYGQTKLVESEKSTEANWPASAGEWTDLGSLTLTPGEWDIIFTVELLNNGTTTFGRAFAAVTTTSGNSSAGIQQGKNAGAISGVGTSGRRQDIQVIRYTVKPNSETTYYLKGMVEDSVTNVQYLYYGSARKVVKR